MRIWIKSSIIAHILWFLIFLFFWFGGILCCCLQKESFIWEVCNFLFFFIARIMNCRNYDHHSIWIAGCVLLWYLDFLFHCILLVFLISLILLSFLLSTHVNLCIVFMKTLGCYCSGTSIVFVFTELPIYRLGLCIILYCIYAFVFVHYHSYICVFLLYLVCHIYGVSNFWRFYLCIHIWTLPFICICEYCAWYYLSV